MIAVGRNNTGHRLPSHPTGEWHGRGAPEKNGRLECRAHFVADLVFMRLLVTYMTMVPMALAELFKG